MEGLLVKINYLEFLHLMPELVLVFFSFLIMSLDLILKDKKLLRPFTYLSLLITLLVEIIYKNFGESFKIFVQDSLSYLMKIFIILVSFLILPFLDRYLKSKGSFYPEVYYLYLFTIVGMMFLVSSYNLLMIYVSLELVSVGFYVLTALLRGSFLSKEGAFKYLILGGVAIALASYGAFFMYLYSGSLDLREVLTYKSENKLLLNLGLTFFLIGMAIKIGAVPFHFWLPDAYQGAPTPITSFMASVGKLSFFIPLLRVVPYLQRYEDFWVVLVGFIAVLTMLFGNLVALVQKDLKRLLAYSSIAHSGYMLAGLTSVSFIGIKAVGYFLIAYALMSSGSFLIVAYLEEDERFKNKVEQISGLRFSNPTLALSFSLFMFSLLGVPITVGFFAKFLVFTSLANKNLYLIALLMALATAISTGYYLRLVVLAFMREGKESLKLPKLDPLGFLSLLLLTLSLFFFALFPGTVYDLIRW